MTTTKSFTSTAVKISLAIVAAAVIAMAVIPSVGDAHSGRVDRMASVPSVSNSKYIARNLKASNLKRDSVTLTWEAPKVIKGSSAKKMRYYVYEVIDGKPYLIGEKHNGKTTMTLTGVAPSLKHTYFIQASHPDSSIGYNSKQLKNVYTGDYKTLLVTKPGSDRKRPNAPIYPKASADANALYLSWQANPGKDKDLLGYRVYRVTTDSNGQAMARIVAEVKHSGTKKNYGYSFIGIESSSRHAFYVKAVDKNGNVSDATRTVYVSNGYPFYQ